MTLEPQPRRFFTCDRHPDEQFASFCASCLRERLEGLDQAARGKNSSASSSTATTAASAALKALFKGSGGGGDDKHGSRNKASSSSSFLPELRRSKSFSGGKGEGFSGVFEPQRRSCDVRVRNTLWSLFNLDDEKKVENKEPRGEIEVETRNLWFSGVGAPVIESKEEEENEEEIRVSEDVLTSNVDVVEDGVEEEIVEESVAEVVEEEEEEEVKTMKDHIDLDTQTKKPAGRDLKEIAGSFWMAASVFSKKLQKWRRKQKMKKRRNGGGSSAMQTERPVARHFRETQSEIADYGFGRRSCDTDPRMSLDAARMSFDDPRYSFEEPRASWDGYLIGKMFPRLQPMLSVVEDVPVPVRRSDNQIPVEEPMNSIVEDATTPGGSAQTRDYYSDSSSQRRRKSLDRSSSVRKTEAAVVAEPDEMKSVSNAKVSPATNDYFHGTKVLVNDKDLRDSNSNSLRDDCSESFESAFRDAASIVGGGDRKGSKKSRRWSKAWNIWGLIHRRGGSKEDDEERYYRGNVVERSFSESWPELRREVNGEPIGPSNRKVFRSNSSVSWRNSYNPTGSFGSRRRSYAETNGHGKKREEFVLERNRSARYSPKDVENGLLRFYLTPLRSSRRNGSAKNKQKNSHSIARSVLRLY